jgi:hypothetical protein
MCGYASENAFFSRKVLIFNIVFGFSQKMEDICPVQYGAGDVELSLFPSISY